MPWWQQHHLLLSALAMTPGVAFLFLPRMFLCILGSFEGQAKVIVAPSSDYLVAGRKVWAQPLISPESSTPTHAPLILFARTHLNS